MKRKEKIKWTEPLLIETFGLHRIVDPITDKLKQWITVETEKLPQDTEKLAELRKELIENVDFWNEEELKMNFIAPILNQFVKYKSAHYNTYFDRTIAATINDIPLSTEPDFMIAKGILGLVRNPYFCFHEYKRSKKNPDDPVAQVLIAMLIAQATNKNSNPIYGVYNIGRDWFFMLLEDKTYTISKSFDATEITDLIQIVQILQKFKYILETELLV